MTTNNFLTVPHPSPAPEPEASATSSTLTLRDDRLYVGNLHPSVNEYALLQVFSKCGKVTRLDYLFHKSGPQKGKPRGYAFLEYGTAEEARKAIAAFNDKIVQGRKLVVTFATQSPYADVASSSRSGSRRTPSEASRPTTLSLIKSSSKPETTESKIAALEAKLKQLRAPPTPAGEKPTGLAALPKKPPPPTHGQ
ncbi:uncharacterized protein EI90DRAFT_2902863 [Cantharellus anzutake]|uniref:uncharacterized protein n=1 Tax=Cantharellus anzutake TaxID=1750568 RepID=UPI001903F4D4|nr:uncharacterized protein EI90DRAFT_2902863 [Cantharellus anzutake]KAF8342954.1 hypothetical protein EI90DRAFT_2902863 [Cantharellus anzutake]